MPPSAAQPAGPVVLICGDDDFGVSQRARQLYQSWCAEIGGMDHETIDAASGNSGEALKSIGRLREALNTLPFFGGGKAVWFKDCTFLGDDRTASASAVTETLGELAQELKAFRWEGVRLLISAGKVDKRKTFYKTIEKLGAVESFVALSIDDRDWAARAEEIVLKKFRALKRSITDEALAEIVQAVGPNARQLESEVEKVTLYAADRAEVGVDDVLAVVSRNKQARAFALGDALGDRDLPRLLRCLDEELWEMETDRQKSEIGLLYGLITKVRALLFLKEMLASGWLKEERDYNRFKAQIERVPTEGLPTDRRINPLALNPYVLFKALPQARGWPSGDLVRALDLLLQCNRRLVSRGLDTELVLQQTLTQILRADTLAVTGR